MKKREETLKGMREVEGGEGSRRRGMKGCALEQKRRVTRGFGIAAGGIGCFVAISLFMGEIRMKDMGDWGLIFMPVSFLVMMFWHMCSGVSEESCLRAYLEDQTKCGRCGYDWEHLEGKKCVECGWELPGDVRLPSKRVWLFFLKGNWEIEYLLDAERMKVMWAIGGVLQLMIAIVVGVGMAWGMVDMGVVEVVCGAGIVIFVMLVNAGFCIVNWVRVKMYIQRIS